MILVINCGSSSLKFSLFEQEELRLRGLLECIGEQAPELVLLRGDEEDWRWSVVAGDHGEAMQRVYEVLVEVYGGVGVVEAIGHRIVHGGERFFEAALVTAEVEQGIEECAALAPLHNMAHLSGIRAARTYFADLPQVVVFDTAFHQTIPDVPIYTRCRISCTKKRAFAATDFTVPRTNTYRSGQRSFCSLSILPASLAIWAMALRWRRSVRGARWIRRWG